MILILSGSVLDMDQMLLYSNEKHEKNNNIINPITTGGFVTIGEAQSTYPSQSIQPPLQLFLK